MQIMVLKLYQDNSSSQCRAVKLTAKALGLSLELNDIDMKKNEHKNPEFMQINPMYSIPTLVDDDFTLWERYVIFIDFKFIIKVGHHSNNLHEAHLN